MHEFEHDTLGEYYFEVTSEDDTVGNAIVNYCAVGLHDIESVGESVNATRGETVTVDATVDRMATIGETQSVAFVLDSDDGRLEEFDAEDVALDGYDYENETADAENLSFALDTSSLDPGIYEYSALVGNHGQTGTLTVEATHYQVDFVVGEPNEVLGENTSDFYSPENRLVSYLHGTPGENETLTLSLVSYERMDTDIDFEWTETQTMVDAETKTSTGGTHTFTVDLPGTDDPTETAE